MALLNHLESESCSVMSNSLWPHGLYSPWNSPGQNTGVGSLSLLQGIFPTQGSNPGLPHCRRILYQLSHKGSPWTTLGPLEKPLSLWNNGTGCGWPHSSTSPHMLALQSSFLEMWSPLLTVFPSVITWEVTFTVNYAKNPKKNPKWVIIGSFQAASSYGRTGVLQGVLLRRSLRAAVADALFSGSWDVNVEAVHLAGRFSR